MSDPTPRRRRVRLVDLRSQGAMISGILGLLASAATVFIALAVVIPKPEVFEALPGEALRELVIELVVGSFAISIGCVLIAALVQSHRVAGPALVLKRALKSLQAGDFSPRTTLRQRDHLKDLALEMGSLAAQLRAAHAERTRLLEEAQGALTSGDHERVREHLDLLAALHQPAQGTGARV